MLIVFSIGGYSRETIEVHNVDVARLAACYAHVILTENVNGVAACDTTFAILEMGESIAKYGDFSQYNKDLGEGRNYLPQEFVPLIINEDACADELIQVYQNYPEVGVCTTREYLFPSWYVYEEEEQLKWNILQETDTIKGLCCRKIQTEFHGRLWTAWYTEDIPAPYGPWKLCNAPGLILEASSDDATHRFSCYAIFNIKTAQPISFDRNTETDIVIKGKKFINQRNRLKTDPRWIDSPFYYAQDGIKNVYVIKNETNNKSRLSINGIFYSDTRNKFQPLELK